MDPGVQLQLLEVALARQVGELRSSVGALSSLSRKPLRRIAALLSSEGFRKFQPGKEAAALRGDSEEDQKQLGQLGLKL